MINLSKVSEIEVAFKPHFKLSERPKITSSADTYRLLKNKWNESLMQFLEEFKVILLSRSNKVLGIVDIAKGGKDSVLVDMRVIFSIALKASASKIILAHNHPSGNLTPSEADHAITRKAIEASKLLDIEICDHLIVTANDYYSFKDKGHL